jgi:hypothetical protein
MPYHQRPLSRSGLKTSDQVQEQGAGRSKKHGYLSIYQKFATQPLEPFEPLEQSLNLMRNPDF